MDTLQAILSRASVRKYSGKPVSDEILDQILKAGTAGPSAVNARPWSFLVVRDREKLLQMAEANGRAAGPLKEAAVGILVCGDLDRAFDRAPEYWIIDCAIAAQNMLLAAHDLGLGGVWLGTWPQTDKVERQQTLLGLPKTIVPHSILALGYPAEELSTTPRDNTWEPDRVHYETW